VLKSLHKTIKKENLCKSGSTIMSINISGSDAKIKSTFVSIFIGPDHPLLKLANLLPWVIMINQVVEDLKATTKKGHWWRGRPIMVRIHLAIYLLQKLYDLKDRQAEYFVRDNAAFQLFCGRNVVDTWHIPDHTKIEEFRSRLSPETQRFLANTLAQKAAELGFADPSIVDVDSTVQEANVAYPSDASLMTKLSAMATKVLAYLKGHTRGIIPESMTVDLKAIRSKAREYWFMPKNKSQDLKRAVFMELHQLVKQQLRPIVDLCNGLDQSRITRMPWQIRKSFDQLTSLGWRYLLDVAHFIREESIKQGKVLSFHAQDVACIIKGKAHKMYEFGRVIQLGRISGNFLFALECQDLKMMDKTVFPQFIEEHAKIFGGKKIASIATDKGYYSKKNIKTAQKSGIKEVGIQQPGNSKAKLSNSQAALQEVLKDRRAGIEPLIGHVKQGGQLGRSRMKSDTATKAAAYGSVLGFNLRQMIRHQAGKMKKKAA